MPPAAADTFLLLEHLAGNRRVPLTVFSALVAALPSVSPHTSLRLRKSVALRALDAALSASGADASVLLRNARAVLAEPDLAACFPDHRAFPDDLAALRCFVEAEWASLPPSALETAADQIVRAGADHTWANADQDTRRKLRLLVGESTEREILGKLGQDPSKDPQVNKPADAPSTSGANEADLAQQDDETHLVRENGEANHVQEDCARPQHHEPVERTTDAGPPENPVTSEAIKGKDRATTSHVTGQIAPDNNQSHPTASGYEQDEDGEADHVQEDCAQPQQDPVERTTDARPSSDVTGQIAPDNNKSHPVKRCKPSLMERNPTASVYEWDDLDESDLQVPPRARQLPTYNRQPRPPPAFPQKRRKKKWTDIEERSLMEGVEKYGKGNWTDIKTAYPVELADRSTVDLKDKFRNMERYH